ncbi:sigma-54 interaction domain-containing protein [Oceanirhabdus seepicola]|uniref:Sigma 54-interacting transcriptional regulator n=1 Tax=Oceanirhabdus seepicola TaxID=2828781 RepID=A0A9J6PAR0_9CLOT|nr:sigma 54-interacting transcriptional regulator [Oceanirhabdus seepicola]
MSLLQERNTFNILKEIFEKLPIPINLVDDKCRIIYINNAFLKFLDKNREELLGKETKAIESTSRLHSVIENKKAEIAYEHTFTNGKTAIVHRIPILDHDDNVIGGFGMVLFDNMDKLKELMNRCNLLKKELKLYKSTINRMNSTKYTLDDIIGVSDEMANCKKKVIKISKVNMNVLIKGESGVGKELFAHSIHNESSRWNNPFVTINCSAIPENLFESELFGYNDGAFTGGKKGGHIGKFQLADGGTVFLDEIGEMPHYMQAKLLRVLQEGEIAPIGAESPIKVNVRVICATHQDIERMVKEGEFREDLYYRLNVLSLNIPSLRARKNDIDLLMDKFVEGFYKETGVYRVIDQNGKKIFREYNWPGNVRELKNMVERVCVNADDVIVNVDDFPIDLIRGKRNYVKENSKEDSLKDIIGNIEKEIIFKTLKECDFNKSETAKKLKIQRASLYRKMEEYDIEEK